MKRFITKKLPANPDVAAADGSDVRILAQLKGGSMAHFELGPGKTSNAIAHKTVEEIWFFLNGTGEMWRKQDDIEEIVKLEQGVCITIPVGTHFQFRSFCSASLAAIAITMPPWPGEDEVFTVKGKWTA